MPGSQTTWGRTGTCANAPVRVAFCFFEGISTPDGIFAAQWLAYTHPCQRFTYTLADIRA